jgi:tight adherence protein B
MLPAAFAALIALLCLGMALRENARQAQRLEELLRDNAAQTETPPDLARFCPDFLRRAFDRLGIAPTAREIASLAAGAALALTMVAILFGVLFALALAAAMALLGYAALNLLAARRAARLGAALPGFFDRVRQLLVIGNSLPTAFTRAAQSSQPLLADFFTPTLRRMNNGAGMGESLQQCAEEIGLHEMRLFAASVAANMRFGGSLSHALANLVTYLRRRAAVERELRAETAQIRLSAWVLALLPLLVAGLIMTQNHDYARWFLVHPAGRKMLAYCVVSQIAGALLMRRIVRMAY